MGEILDTTLYIQKNSKDITYFGKILTRQSPAFISVINAAGLYYL